MGPGLAKVHESDRSRSVSCGTFTATSSATAATERQFQLHRSESAPMQAARPQERKRTMPTNSNKEATAQTVLTTAYIEFGSGVEAETKSTLRKRTRLNCH